MKVNLMTKNSTVLISNKPLVLLGVPHENFLQTLEREVKRNPQLMRLKVKELKKTVSKMHMTFNSLLVLAPQTVSIIPPEVIQTFVTIMVVIFFMGIVVGTATYMLAGIWKMLRGKSDEWTKEIIKGIGQVVLAPVIVSLIVLICVYLFGNLPVYQPFKEAIGVFWHSL